VVLVSFAFLDDWMGNTGSSSFEGERLSLRGRLDGNPVCITVRQHDRELAEPRSIYDRPTKKTVIAAVARPEISLISPGWALSPYPLRYSE
jgi:hypothetical protein